MKHSIGSKRRKLLIKILIEKRHDAGLTQQKLADKLGVYQSYIARLESGQRSVEVVELLILAKAMNFDAVSVIKELEASPE